jgi:hypothetical protein
MKQRPTEKKHGSPRRVCKATGETGSHSQALQIPIKISSAAYQRVTSACSTGCRWCPRRLPRPEWLRSVARLTCNWLGMQPLPHLAKVVIHDKVSLLDEIAYTISAGRAFAGKRTFAFCHLQSALVFTCRCLRAESFKDEGEASE